MAWYIIKQILKGNPNQDNIHEFDAYVSYSSKDIQWILHKLLPALGTKDVFKKPRTEKGRFLFCLKDLHFEIGIPIVDNVVRSIDSSRCIIIFVTKSFTRCKWSRFEANYIQSNSLSVKHKKVVLVLHNEIEKNRNLKVPDSIKVLMKTGTCLDWPSEEDGEDVFWMRLQQEL